MLLGRAIALERRQQVRFVSVKSVAEGRRVVLEAGERRRRLADKRARVARQAVDQRLDDHVVRRASFSGRSRSRIVLAASTC